MIVVVDMVGSGHEARLRYVGQVDRADIAVTGTAILAAHHNHRIQVVRVVHHFLRVVSADAVLTAFGTAYLETSQHLLLVLGQRHETLRCRQVVGDADRADGFLGELVSALPR